MNPQFDFADFIGGIPIKQSDATKDTLDGKAFRIGFQTAKLQNERQALDQDKALFEQEKAAVIQQLLSAQAQAATLQGARAGASAGMAAGLGYNGIPVGPGGEIGQPPMPMPMDPMMQNGLLPM